MLGMADDDRARGADAPSWRRAFGGVKNSEQGYPRLHTLAATAKKKEKRKEGFLLRPLVCRRL